MSNRNSAFGLGLVFTLLVALTTVTWAPEPPLAAAEVQVSKDQFARYTTGWSEPEGFFDSDNFISNETSYLHVIDQLQEQVRPGDVYLGVGPDQNFSYIAHTRPALAIIVDIRRQNMLQHLLFKALFERASSRAEYLALLFAKQTPKVASNASLRELMNAIRRAPSTEAQFHKNLEWVEHALLVKYGLKLSAEDLGKVAYVYRSFWTEGLDLRFSTLGRPSYFRYPTYEELLVETDRRGRYQSFVSSEELFLWLKKFQAENRVIPIVGDFAGSHAFRAVAAFLKEKGLRISALYTSNVEFYLFGRPGWNTYLDNLRALPVSEKAVFIRAYFQSSGRRHPLNVAGHRSTSLVHWMRPFLEDYDSGRLTSYWQVVRPDQ